jgi:hypothetical protein
LGEATVAEQELSASIADRNNPGSWLVSLAYRSRSFEVPTEAEMSALLAHARQRNRSVGVTGMLVYERGRFYQWLEGPSAGVSEVWRSIRHDSRHADIELLGEQRSPTRLFGAWDMLWLRRQARRGDSASGSAKKRRHQHVGKVAQLAIAGDGGAIDRLTNSLLSPGEDATALYGDLFEPAARLLGDWWCQDQCNDLDVTFALGILQVATRRLSNPLRSPVEATAGDVLVAPHPREAHILGTILASDVFRHANWHVSVEFPRSDRELIDIVRDTWFDVLNLSLSDAYSREHRLLDMAATIRALRKCSVNPRIVIVVGGRAFIEHAQTAAAIVGADIAYVSSIEAVDQTGWALCRRITSMSTAAVASMSHGNAPPLMALHQSVPVGWHVVPEVTANGGPSISDGDQGPDARDVSSHL